MVNMGRAVPFMLASLGAPIMNTIFATDAMGANDTDNGGFGLVAKDVAPEMAEKCYELGKVVSHTVATLSGGFEGLKYPMKSINATVPFSTLPPELFDKPGWELLGRGRWEYSDHITLGEARAVYKLAHALAGDPRAHHHKILTLQDNAPCAGAMNKGRSQAPALNYIIRRKAAMCLLGSFTLILPWIQTTLMPADEASRLLST
jgi:hypothetical protein